MAAFLLDPGYWELFNHCSHLILLLRLTPMIELSVYKSSSNTHKVQGTKRLRITEKELQELGRVLTLEACAV